LVVQSVVTASKGRIAGLLAVLVAAAAMVAASLDAGSASGQRPLSPRTVLLVGNNWDGTVDIIDPRSFRKLGQINVAPDYEGCVSDSYPTQGPACVINNEFAAEGNPQLVDDMRVSPDGRTLYVSRPSLGDATAFDVTTGTQLWRTPVSGFRSDHLALSPDGTELMVSATVGRVVEVIDTSSGQIIDQIPTGDFPHENEFSHNGELLYNGSIGRVITPDDPALDALKGDRWFTIADADTHEVVKHIDFGVGIRPFHVLPDERTMYAQLSFLHGFIEYDLVEERTLRTVNLPLMGAQQGDNVLDSAHHGLALNEDFSKICAAGTVADYVAIVSRPGLTVDNIIPVGDQPYWATSSPDGKYCFVSNSQSDDVSVISYDDAVEVARFPVGDHPQRARVVSMVVPRKTGKQ
jgi:YVTN family beta-propeller protein